MEKNQKFISYEKLSKKKKRELDAGRRTVWAISPVTRRPDNPKVYKRKHRNGRMIPLLCFCFFSHY